MKPRHGEHPWGDAGQLVLLGLFLAALLGTSAILVRSGHRAVDHGAGGLVTDGAVRRVRHALYLGSVLFHRSYRRCTGMWWPPP
jgi:protein-S-isoprenylcysteine O-methyltransferase Ste14